MSAILHAAEGFTPTGCMRSARVSNTATVLTDGKVLIAGGFGTDPSNLITNAEVYDPVSGMFTTSGIMAKPRFGHSATLLNNGKVLITGGFDQNFSFLADAELYDPATGTFAATGSMNFG